MRLGKIWTTVALACMCAAPIAIPGALAQQRAALGPRADAAQAVSFDVYLPLQHQAELDALLADQQNSQSANYHKWLKPAEFDARFGTTPETLKAVRQELEAYGLTTKATSSHILHVTGNARSVEQIFATELHTAAFANGRQTIAASRPLSLPSTMRLAGAAVAGLTNAIWMHPDSYRGPAPGNRSSRDGGYWFDDLKQAYSFPSYKAYNGKGVSIGILMSSDYKKSDMDLYFSHEKLKTPGISEVKVNGGAPFSTNSGGSFEAELDLQQSGGTAPDASIVLFNIPDLSYANILAGLYTIVASNITDVVSMSFGGPELFFTAPYNGGVDQRGLFQAFDDLFKQGNAQGITFVASTGDTGANEVPPVACFAPNATSSCGYLLPSVQYPASSPHVTAVGGTNLITRFTPGSLDSTYVREAAFGDKLQGDINYGTPAKGNFWASGGGNSIVFAKPSYQKAFDTGSGYRTTPDVSLQMGGCPLVAVMPCEPDRSFTVEAFGGKLVGAVGTSVAAPDFAGLTALKVQRAGGRLGNVNSTIYAMAAAEAHGGPVVFHRNIPGYNGRYFGGGVYNRVLGVGTVYGYRYLNAPNVPIAGVPQTPSNP